MDGLSLRLEKSELGLGDERFPSLLDPSWQGTRIFADTISRKKAMRCDVSIF